MSTDNDADSPPTAAADGETEFMDDAIRNAPTPAAWSTEPEAIDYPPTDAQPTITPPPPSWGRVWGYVAVVLSCAVVIAILAGIVGWIWTKSDNTTATPQAVPTQSTTPTASHAMSNLPGTDNLGFIDYPGARCDPGNEPAVMARTTLSVLVVCQLSPGNYYYRAVRVSDNASIELANAVRSSDGFDVTDPADGSIRQVRPTYVKIVFPGGPVQLEPTIGYALSPEIPAPTVKAPPSTTMVAPSPDVINVDPGLQLRTQAQDDRSVVTTWAQHRWVPQLSSKRPGTRDDGIIWDDNSIWQEHSRLRQQYDAKLLWSGDWPNTFKGNDYWVTIAGMSYPDRASAQAWCDDHGRDSDHCLPTLIQ